MFKSIFLNEITKYNFTCNKLSITKFKIMKLNMNKNPTGSIASAVLQSTATTVLLTKEKVNVIVITFQYKNNS